MWINFTDDEVELARRALNFWHESDKIIPSNDGGERAKRMIALQAKIEEAQADFDPADPYRAAAKEQANDELEVDDDAVVSPGSDPGAWVHAWIWITDQEAGTFTCEECSGVFTRDRLMSGECDVCDECGNADDDEPERCDTCGVKLDEAGDGYDGKCADCADKVAQCENCGNTDNDGSDICPDCKGTMTSHL